MDDALSRRSQIMQVVAISEWKSDLKIGMHEAIREYGHYLLVVAASQSDSRPSKFVNYSLTKDRIFRFQNKNYIPTEGN